MSVTTRRNNLWLCETFTSGSALNLAIYMSTEFAGVRWKKN